MMIKRGTLNKMSHANIVYIVCTHYQLLVKNSVDVDAEIFQRDFISLCKNVNK